MSPVLPRKPYPSDVSDKEWSLVVQYRTLMTEAVTLPPGTPSF
ncbi:hypothetical protein [Lichenicola cladoniae]|nr:hypothetical protein [Lichenicola cladoniae]